MRKSNLPLCNLFYVTAQFRREYDNRRIYSRKQVKIPTPKFVVFYNGNEECWEEYEIGLKEGRAEYIDNFWNSAEYML